MAFGSTSTMYGAYGHVGIATPYQTTLMGGSYTDPLDRIRGTLALIETTCYNIAAKVFKGQKAADSDQAILDQYGQELLTHSKKLKELRTGKVSCEFKMNQDALITKCAEVLTIFENNAKNPIYQNATWHFGGIREDLKTTKEELINCSVAFWPESIYNPNKLLHL